MPSALTNLRIVGLVCPCHESDVEHDARVAVNALQKVPIQWYRTTTHSSWQVHSTILLDATLSIVHDAHQQQHGPCLQVSSRDANLQLNTFCNDEYILQATTRRQTTWRVPLSDIRNIELVETPYHAEIHIHSSTRLLLKCCLCPPPLQYNWYHCIRNCSCQHALTPVIVVEYLQAIQIWNDDLLQQENEVNERRLAGATTTRRTIETGARRHKRGTNGDCII